jgi:hypothetical protein
LKPRRHAIATYLQTFILVAVVLAGSLLAYNAASPFAHAAGGPSVRILEASIRQEAGFAVERFAVSDSGTSRLPYLTVLNSDLSRATSYCYVASSINGTEITKTCPVLEADPTSVNFTASLAPGGTVVIVMLLSGAGVVEAGSSYTLTVAAPGAVATQMMVATTA